MLSKNKSYLRHYGILHKSLLILLSILFISYAVLSQVKAPETRKDNFKENLHGVEIVDPFRWLEDQESVETSPSFLLMKEDFYIFLYNNKLEGKNSYPKNQYYISFSSRIAINFF